MITITKQGRERQNVKTVLNDCFFPFDNQGVEVIFFWLTLVTIFFYDFPISSITQQESETKIDSILRIHHNN